MYSVSSLKQGIDDPRRILQEFNRLYYRRLKTRPYNEEGLDVFERDWDTLCILDACKYDLFEERNTLPGNLEKVVSRSSSTKEFLRANFHGREFLDTVYVTGSPMLHRLRDRIDTQFHDVINVWQEEGWDETCRTVMPETMADATRKARAEYPNKRLFVHFLQPHYPFIGPIGREHFDLDRLNFEWDKLAVERSIFRKTWCGRLTPRIWTRSCHTSNSCSLTCPAASSLRPTTARCSARAHFRFR